MFLTRRLIKQQTDLHQLIMDRNWEEASKHLKTHPNDAKLWSRVAFDDGIYSDVLPIHLAARGASPISLIQDLIDAYPKGASKADLHFNRQPLHFACLHNPNVEIIGLLIDHYPEAVSMVDKGGRIPLHYASVGRAKESVFHLLLDVCAKSAQQLDHTGWLPLHVAVRYNAPSGAIEQIYKAYPDAVKIRTSKGGMTPAAINQAFGLRLEEHTLQLIQPSINSTNLNSSRNCVSPKHKLLKSSNAVHNSRM